MREPGSILELECDLMCFEHLIAVLFQLEQVADAHSFEKKSRPDPAPPL